MQPPVSFSVEIIDGYPIGKLAVPTTEIADWLNFLLSPQYDAEIVAAEQERDRLDIYFEASEGLYLYLDSRLNAADLAIAC